MTLAFELLLPAGLLLAIATTATASARAVIIRTEHINGRMTLGFD